MIVRILRPRIVLVENVPGLLARGMGRVLGDLAASGYDAQWDCVPAEAVGAPHLRYRVFIVAYAERSEWWQSHPERCNVEREGSLQAGRKEGSGWPGIGSAAMAYADSGNEYGRLGNVQMGRRWFAGEIKADGLVGRDEWGSEPDVGRVAHGIPSRLDRLRGLGNAVVPQVAEWIGRRILEADNTQRGYRISDVG